MNELLRNFNNASLVYYGPCHDLPCFKAGRFKYLTNPQCLPASVTSARDGDVERAPQHRDCVPVQLLTCRPVRS